MILNSIVKLQIIVLLLCGHCLLSSSLCQSPNERPEGTNQNSRKSIFQNGGKVHPIKSLFCDDAAKDNFDDVIKHGVLRKRSVESVEMVIETDKGDVRVTGREKEVEGRKVLNFLRIRYGVAPVGQKR